MMVSKRAIMGLIIFGAILIGTILLVGEATGKTITVDDDNGDADYSTIQEAIDGADPGDTIRIYAGTYLETVLVNKSVNLEGNGSEVTIIDGERKGDVVFISADHVNVSGISAINSASGNFYAGISVLANFTTISEVNCSDNNHGIFLKESNNILVDRVFMRNIPKRGVDIRDCDNITISNMIAYWIDWDGVYHARSDNCTFIGNNITSNGTAIRINDSLNTTFVNNVCSSYEANGILLSGSDGFSMINNTCYDNEYNGLNIRITANGTIRNNTITGSRNGIELYRTNSISVIQNDCIGNNSHGIYVTVTENCTIQGNNCSGNSGRGITLYSSCYRNVVRDNYCAANGQYGVGAYRSENNTFENNTCPDNVGQGISLYDSDNMTVMNNICNSNGRYGIENTRSDHCIIAFNSFQGNPFYGIDIEATNCNVFNNTVFDNNNGIYVYRAENNSIHDNLLISNHVNGIQVYYSSNNLISNNTIANNSLHAIYVVYSTHNTFSGNRMEGGSIGIRGYTEERWNTHDFSQGNTVNGKPVYHFRGTSNLTTPTDGGQIILTNCSNMTVKDSNFSNVTTGILIGFSSDITVVNLTSRGNSDRGIHMVYASNCSVTDSDLSNNQYGMYLENCENNTLVSIKMVMSLVEGIRLDESKRNDIKWCHISDSERGIYIHDSSNNNLTNSTIQNTLIGILQDGTSFDGYSVNNSIYNSHLAGNEQYGIRIDENGGYSINATDNWWGHDSGPSHSSHPHGQGDNISDDVDFTPWEGNYPFIDLVSPNPATDYEPIVFKGHGIGEIQRYVWTSSIDGEFYNGTEPEISYLGLSLGEHTISFRVRNQVGNWSVEVNATLNVTTRPEARIHSITPNPALDTDHIEFKGNGTDGDGQIQRFVWWSSVDGEFYNGSQEDFSYGNLSVGDHIITLMVQDDHGVWSNETSVDIYINGKPVAYIDSITPNPAPRTDMVQFQGHATDDRSIVRYVWTSSIDGELSNGTESSFSTDVLKNGTHTIYLRVQDDNGTWSDSDPYVLIINGKPVATAIEITPDPVHQGDWVYLNASGTDDGDIIRYAWRSSIDGQFYIGSKAEVTTNTLSPGYHNIFLRIMDEHDVWSEEISGQLHVNGLPIANIKFILPNPGVTGNYITFKEGSSDDGSIQLYEWDFNGDGTFDWSSTESGNISCVYDTPGTYYPVLQVTDDMGAMDFATLKLIIDQRPAEADFSVFHDFDPLNPINETNDGMVNGFIDLFYGDQILLEGRMNDYSGDDEIDYRWEIRCIQTDHLTRLDGEIFEGMVGEDFFFPGTFSGYPTIPDLNSGPKTYEITVYANDLENEYSRSDFIRVYPYAYHTFTKDVIIGSEETMIWVDVTWRGIVNQVADTQEDISESKPVFIFINETAPPEQDLGERGGIGPVYEITSVGCTLQDGSPGIIETRITIPILREDLERIGDIFILEPHLKVEWYDDFRDSFQVLEDGTIWNGADIVYVTGSLDHLSLFTVIVDSIYNTSNPAHMDILPDLSVEMITYSHSPVLDGQIVEIRAEIVNTGLTHARNVDVTFYDEDTLLGERTVELVNASRATEYEVIITFKATIIEPFSMHENHYIRVVVNELRTIDEGPDQYKNNIQQDLIVFVASSPEPTPKPRITSPKNGATIQGVVKITGDITNITDVGMVNQPFGNNDFAWYIEKVNPDAVSVYSVKYRLLDHNGEYVEGGNGTVRDVYGLNYDDPFTPISFQDNDRDGKLSAGDVFLVKSQLNGGLAWTGYSLQLECGWVDLVEISINGGNWAQVSGTDPWSYNFDPNQIEEGTCDISIRAIANGDNTDGNSVEVQIAKNEKEEESSDGFNLWIFMGLLILIISIFIMVMYIKNPRGGDESKVAMAPTGQNIMGQPQVPFPASPPPNDQSQYYQAPPQAPTAPSQLDQPQYYPSSPFPPLPPLSNAMHSTGSTTSCQSPSPIPTNPPQSDPLQTPSSASPPPNDPQQFNPSSTGTQALDTSSQSPTSSNPMVPTGSIPDTPLVTGEVTKSLKCHNCGFTVEAFHKFCEGCGHLLEHVPEERSSETGSDSTDEEQTQEKEAISCEEEKKIADTDPERPPSESLE